jgi:hypothetical protein
MGILRTTKAPNPLVIVVPMDFVVWTTQVEERPVLKEPPFAAASRNVLDEDAVIQLVSVALPGAGTQRGTELDQTELSRCRPALDPSAAQNG